MVGQESAGARAVREFIAAYNDPDTTRIMKYVATAFEHREAIGIEEPLALRGAQHLEQLGTILRTGEIPDAPE